MKRVQYHVNKMPYVTVWYMDGVRRISAESLATNYVCSNMSSGGSSFRFAGQFMSACSEWKLASLLKGSWDLVTRVINKVAILIITYNPQLGDV